MKAILVNDTTNNDHVGCLATMSVFYREIHRNAIQIIRVFSNRELRSLISDKNENIDDSINRADIIIINAEGSLHSGRSYELKELMNRARAAKKPYFVLNAFISGDETIFSILADAEIVTARDAESYRQLQRHSVNSLHCLDAAIFANFDTPDLQRQIQNVGVTDWHGEARTAAQQMIRHLLQSSETEIVPLLRPDAVQAWRQFPNIITKYPILATARYHGAIFAAMRGIPFIIVGSNSIKMERLSEEYGISDWLAAHLPQNITTKQLIELAKDNKKTFIDLSNKILEKSKDEQNNPLSVIRRHMNISGSRYVAKEEDISEMVSALEISLPKTPAGRYAALRQLLAATRQMNRISRALAARIRGLGFSSQDIIRALEAHKEFLSFGTLLVICDLFVSIGDINQIMNLRKIIVDKKYNYDQEMVDYIDYVLVVNMHKHGAITYAMGLGEKLIQRKSRYMDHVNDILASRWTLFKKPDIASIFIKNKRKIDNVTDCRTLWWGGDLNKALDCTRLLLDEQPENVDAKILFGELNFVASKFNEAWDYLHCGSMLYRSGTANMPSRDQVIKLLASGEDIAVVFEEQYGVGVSALMMTILSDIVSMGRKIFVHADSRLKALFDQAFPQKNIEFIALGSSDIDHENAISMMSLGLALRQRRSDFPGLPLIKNKCNGKIKRIGFVWSTPNKYSAWYRNIPDSVIVDLANRLNAEYELVSLEIDNESARSKLDQLGLNEIIRIPEGPAPKDDIAGHLGELKNLDAIVGIDCSSTIFGAAIGKPTFVFKSRPHSWLWPEGEERSIFFSNQRFISRVNVEEWSGQIEHLVDCLEQDN